MRLLNVLEIFSFVDVSTTFFSLIFIAIVHDNNALLPMGIFFGGLILVEVFLIPFGIVFMYHRTRKELRNMTLRVLTGVIFRVCNALTLGILWWQYQWADRIQFAIASIPMFIGLPIIFTILVIDYNKLRT